MLRHPRKNARALRFKPPEKFETLEVAKKRRQKCIAHLMALTNNEKAQVPATKLLSCRKSARCRSGACPVCMRLYRLRWIKECCKLLAQLGDVYRVSMILDHASLEPDSLHLLDLPKFLEAQQTAINRALPDDLKVIIIGGIDISLNTLENGDAHWCPHLYLLIASASGQGLSKDVLDDSLKPMARRSSASRPYMSTLVKQHGLGKPPCPGLIPLPLSPEEVLAKVVSYALKAAFVHRSGYGYIRRLSNEQSHNTRPQSLRGPSLTEALLFMGQHGPGKRVLLRGVRRFGRPERFVLRLGRRLKA